MNLSFAGCGFMGVYHIGVVQCFRHCAPDVLKNKVSQLKYKIPSLFTEIKICGASAGATVALSALTDTALGQYSPPIIKSHLISSAVFRGDGDQHYAGAAPGQAGGAGPALPLL